MSRGLWDGHEYRSTLSRADAISALGTAVVVVDTNVLLDLYRYVTGPRDKLLRALEEIKERIFIPHQVALEFWRGREGALNDVAIRRPPVVEQLTDAGENARQSINGWANRVGLGLQERADVVKVIADAVEEARSTIEQLAAEERSARASDTSEDLILDRIVELCDGRVGEVPDVNILNERKEEGLRRAESGEPPGYRDKKKDPDRVVGDYLLWCESMDEACARNSDLVFVTRDTKEDWWTIVNGEPIGPRLELTEEFWRKSSGGRTYFLRPSQFVSMVAEANGWPASDAVAQLEVTERAEVGGGWSHAAARELLSALRDSYRPQFEAVKYAAEHDGRVPREVLYALGGYGADRTLRGFGRPVNRLARDIHDPNRVLEEFPLVFDSYYNPKVSWVQVAGFYLADSLAVAVRGLLETEEFISEE